MASVTELLSGITMQDPVTFRNLSVFPLIHPSQTDPAYATLDDAIAANTVTVAETSESGTVPRIRIVNKGHLPILLLDGEELLGAKQNRILNLTILAPADTTIEVPVSCVEAGRWSYRSDRFEAANRAAYSSLRARKVRRVSRNLAMSGSRDADQGEIWDDIAMKSHRLHGASPTGAMGEMYESHGSVLDEFAKAFRPASEQAGAIFAIDGQIVGLDIFDHPSTFRKLAPKLLRSYALDALDVPDRPLVGPSRRDGERFIHEITFRAESTEFPAIGEGTDIRLSGRSLTGSALEWGGSVIHLCAFRLTEGTPRRGPGTGPRGFPMARASLRRQRRKQGGARDEPVDDSGRAMRAAPPKGSG